MNVFWQEKSVNLNSSLQRPFKPLPLLVVVKETRSFSPFVCVQVRLVEWWTLMLTVQTSLSGANPCDRTFRVVRRGPPIGCLLNNYYYSKFTRQIKGPTSGSNH